MHSINKEPRLMSDCEKRIVLLLAAAWNEFMKLGSTNGDDRTEFRGHIHGLQNMIMARVVQQSEAIEADEPARFHETGTHYLVGNVPDEPCEFVMFDNLADAAHAAGWEDITDFVRPDHIGVATLADDFRENYGDDSEKPLPIYPVPHLLVEVMKGFQNVA